jgi:hypothetical protein
MAWLGCGQVFDVNESSNPALLVPGSKPSLQTGNDAEELGQTN